MKEMIFYHKVCLGNANASSGTAKETDGHNSTQTVSVLDSLCLLAQVTRHRYTVCILLLTMLSSHQRGGKQYMFSQVKKPVNKKDRESRGVYGWGKNKGSSDKKEIFFS